MQKKMTPKEMKKVLMEWVKSFDPEQKEKRLVEDLEFLEDTCNRNLSLPKGYYEKHFGMKESQELNFRKLCKLLLDDVRGVLGDFREGRSIHPSTIAEIVVDAARLDDMVKRPDFERGHISREGGREGGHGKAQVEASYKKQRNERIWAAYLEKKEGNRHLSIKDIARQLHRSKLFYKTEHDENSKSHHLSTLAIYSIIRKHPDYSVKPRSRKLK